MSIRPIRFILVIGLVIAAASSSWAIQRVAPRLNVIEIYGGYAMPYGEYDGTVCDDFIYEGRKLKTDADNIYDDGFSFGMSYGRVLNTHWLVSVGLRFTQSSFKDIIVADLNADTQVGFVLPETPNARQYDVDLNCNYMFNDLNNAFWSPYLGLGVNAGVSEASFEGYNNEHEASIALSCNFGLDLKVWSASDNRSFVTVGSFNTWNIIGSGDRPSYLHLGGGIKYYFRP